MGYASPYIERINRRGTNNLYTDHTFYSSLDGELASTTAGQGGIGDLALDEAVLLTGDQTLLAETLAASEALPLETATTTEAATSTPRESEKTSPGGKEDFPKQGPGNPLTEIESLLQGKSADEKATIKGREIAKIGTVPRTERDGYELEFVSFNPIPGGVEIFARVWQGGQQIGFGRDGSVDIERFRVFNPPILVADPGGSIEREFENPDTGEITIKRFREDPEEAMLQAIAHAVKVKKEKFAPDYIVPGKVGNTTSLFYPAAGANSPVDGWIEKEDEATWSAARDASTGDNANPTTAYLQAVARKLSCGGCDYTVRRSFTFFDTSSIASSTISGATLSLKRDDAAIGFANADSVSWSVAKVTNNSSDSSLATSDFNKTGSTEAGSRKQLSGTTVDIYSDFTFIA